MCGNPYSRTPTVDSGDLIAIIHPSQILTNSFIGGKLKLSNRKSGATVSSLDCSSSSNSNSNSSDDSESSDADNAETLNVRIHKYGQPLSIPDLANPVMHSFFIRSCHYSTAGIRLNLSVGGDGVVGRTVSITDSTRRLLGEGVIGWS